jgi:hypothetical protein
LSQYNFSGLYMFSITFRPGKNFFIHIACPTTS